MPRRAGERPARLKAAAAVRAPPTLTPEEALREERRCVDKGDGVFNRFASAFGGEAGESCLPARMVCRLLASADPFGIHFRKQRKLLSTLRSQHRRK